MAASRSERRQAMTSSCSTITGSLIAPRAITHHPITLSPHRSPCGRCGQSLPLLRAHRVTGAMTWESGPCWSELNHRFSAVAIADCGLGDSMSQPSVLKCDEGNSFFHNRGRCPADRQLTSTAVFFVARGGCSLVDAKHFDQIARALSASGTRRSAVRLLTTVPFVSALATLFAGANTAADDDDHGSSHRRHRRKARHRHQTGNNKDNRKGKRKRKDKDTDSGTSSTSCTKRT